MLLDNELIESIRRLNELFEFQYYGLKGMADNYINNKEKNINKIEHLLDSIMESYEFVNDAKNTFNKLCDYLETINIESAKDYRNLWYEFYEAELEELEDNTKTLKKEK